MMVTPKKKMTISVTQISVVAPVYRHPDVLPAQISSPKSSSRRKNNFAQKKRQRQKKRTKKPSQISKFPILPLHPLRIAHHEHRQVLVRRMRTPHHHLLGMPKSQVLSNPALLQKLKPNRKQSLISGFKTTNAAVTRARLINGAAQSTLSHPVRPTRKLRSGKVLRWRRRRRE
jgi:hypothetical protein